MQHWYVYYKLEPAERDAMRARVRRMQDDLARSAAVSVRLLERTEQGETTTMMEVYEDIADADGFGRALDAAVRAHLPDSRVAARRIERFRDA